MLDPADLSITEASQSIHGGHLSPTELLESCLARMDRVEGEVRAFASVNRERAMADATALTEELVDRGPRSPLHGIPMGIKDMIDVAGFPTRAGSHVLDGEPIPEDAPVAARLRAAGAVITGKTTTHEFACGITTPPTRNPWDLSRIPGGSSGGSGAAVAAGECIAALGTDSGGSIRVPASFCGVSGLRPRLGTTPPEGIIPLSWTHDTCGPMARTAEDLAMVWSILAPDFPVSTDLALSTLTIGIPDPLPALLEMDPEVEKATYTVADVLESEGAARQAVDLPPFKEWDVPRKVVVVSDMLAMHRQSGWYPQRADLYSEDTRAFIQRGEKITGADLVLARRELQGLGERFHSVFEQVDVLLLPSVILAAPTLEEALGKKEVASHWAESVFGGGRPLVPEVMRATGPVGWCGLAAASVPSGVTSDGLPVGVQFVARDETTALSAAARYQEVTDFHKARPLVHAA